MRVSAYFIAPMLLVITDIGGTLYSGIVACFKMKIEHENLHRNTPKNYLLYPASDQQHTRVVAFFAGEWYQSTPWLKMKMAFGIKLGILIFSL